MDTRYASPNKCPAVVVFVNKQTKLRDGGGGERERGEKSNLAILCPEARYEKTFNSFG